MPTSERVIRSILHDIKTPLNAIAGFADLLDAELHGPLNKEQRKFATGIRAAVKRADELLDTLLLTSRLEAGTVPVRKEPTRLPGLVQRAADERRAEAELRDLELSVSNDVDTPVVETDPVLVMRVLSNLLSNAVKYTPAGGSVRIESKGPVKSPGGRQWVVVSVADTGPGVSREFRETIFEEFKRLPNAGHTEGSGMGLAISRRVSHLLGGDLKVESNAGQGSRFTLWLPQW